MKKLLVSLLFALSACTAELPAEEKLEQADAYLSEHGGEPGYRALAYDLYKEVLDETSVKEFQVRAHFGLGIIGFFDIVQGLPRLMAEDEAAAEDEKEESSLPPADVLARTIDTLIHEAIDKGIVRHLQVVAEEDEFSFMFESLVFPVTDSTMVPIDLSGEWDLTEIRVIYGALESVVALEETVYSYHGVIEAVLTVVLSGAELPPMPTTPKDFPAWITAVAEAGGLSPLPWLEPEFAVLETENRLSQAQLRLDRGLEKVAEGFAYLQAEKDEQDDDVFPKNEFVGSIVEKLLPDVEGAAIAGAAVTPPLIEDVVKRLHASITDEDNAFVIPDDVWDLLGAVLGDKPNNPVDLRVPAVRPAKFFASPVQDLKSDTAGILPLFDAKGAFIVESEQEPWTDEDEDGEADAGEFQDIGVDGFIDANGDNIADSAGRPGAGNNEFDDLLGLNDANTLPPLKHTSPKGKIDGANGIVDPVYLFFPDASVGGFLVPTTNATSGDDKYAADLDTPYTNADLMRLLSSLIWIIEDSE